MKVKLWLGLITVVFLLSGVLVGCGGGIAPEAYDRMAAELQTANEKIAEMRGEAQDMQVEKQALEADLKKAQARVTEFEGQVDDLKEQYELVGATKAETAENIVRNYYETHEYSTSDLFMCSDMSLEVYNMLKAHDINARIVVGNKDTAITDILQSDHAWVQAEVAPGEYLALETTGGFAVPESKNPLYYRGWYFDSPRDLKRHNELVREYNLRVSIHNDIVAESHEVLDEYNQATNQTTADKLEAVYNKLIELIEDQEAEMNDIEAELSGLATRCST